MVSWHGVPSMSRFCYVQALKQSGEMVAVTGYVTEDAHALYQADTGLAMGIRGAEVAKESSGIIILDDKFATCVKLTVNVVALTTNLMAVVLDGHISLNVVQVRMHIINVTSQDWFRRSTILSALGPPLCHHDEECFSLST
ncbi:autoinhibited Ca(2+)-ATPase 10 [Prunus dulcis]|uniref:Autoinhibited Ca(2+)-ATPase 10 n=1 Tax=Prunus dulcis TaxID=3755 RepID=A0A4Y1RY34_PRUDU|nr:autoinhibited Ca(2+)-ATPase 10 [Prunus dulcis]